MKLCDEFLKDDGKLFKTVSDSMTEIVNRKPNTAY